MIKTTRGLRINWDCLGSLEIKRKGKMVVVVVIIESKKIK